MAGEEGTALFFSTGYSKSCRGTSETPDFRGFGLRISLSRAQRGQQRKKPGHLNERRTSGDPSSATNSVYEVSPIRIARRTVLTKRVAILILLVGCFAPFASAQDDNEHVQVGVFADYLRLDQTSTNFGGVGARVSFQAYKRIKLEGQMAYDFE
jgi:hypothetical protein